MVGRIINTKHGASLGETGRLKSTVITCHHAHWQLYLYAAGLSGLAASCSVTSLEENDSRAVAG